MNGSVNECALHSRSGVRDRRGDERCRHGRGHHTLEDHGVHVTPEILVNAGGVTRSHFGQVQAHSNNSWNGDDVLRRLDS